MKEDKRSQFLEKREKYRENVEKYNCEMEELEKRATHWKNEGNRIYSLLDNPETAIKELADEFKYQTSFDSKDLSFLFFATALQCARWIFQPKVTTKFEKVSRDSRHDAGVDGRKEFALGSKHIEEYHNVTKSRKYPDKAKMFLLPVPYDAMVGTENIQIPGVTSVGKNIYGSNHHAATMGHDPILGYIFGTINILSRTITFKTPMLDSNLVHMKRGTAKSQYVGEPIGFLKALERTAESAREDIGRVPAAIARQALHMQSDKYTKYGLPIPMIAPDKAQRLMEEGWNSYELERLSKFLLKNTATVGLQALLSLMINVAIETIYKLSNDSSVASQIEEVKIRKIIMYSNIISSSSNVVFSALTQDLDNLDFGGLLVTLYRIATDTKIIREIRDEFVYGGYEKKLRLLEY